jgi:hypothetical protein
MSETPQYHPATGTELPNMNSASTVAINTVDVGAIPAADPDGAGYFVSQIGDGLDMGQ